MKTKITKTEAKRLMREIVAKKGADFVFTSTCQYFHDNGRPACIVGHLLHALGVKRKDLATEGWDGGVCSLNEGNGVQEAVEHLFPNTDPVVIDALQVAQSLQDRQYTWGQALEAFERVLKGEDRRVVEGSYAKPKAA